MKNIMEAKEEFVSVFTKDMNGMALDWIVAKFECMLDKPLAIGSFLDGHVPHYSIVLQDFSPSTKWSHCGPIIFREKIATMWWTGKNEWAAKPDSKKSNEPNHFGPTPLIAAMRCFITSKLGDVIEIPISLWNDSMPMINQKQSNLTAKRHHP